MQHSTWQVKLAALILFDQTCLEEEKPVAQASCKMLLLKYKHLVCVHHKETKKAPNNLFSLSSTSPMFPSHRKSFSIQDVTAQESHLKYLTHKSKPEKDTFTHIGIQSAFCKNIHPRKRESV